MTHLIDKDRVVEEIERARNQKIQWMDRQDYTEYYQGLRDAYANILSFLAILEVKGIGDNSLEKFKSLQHISRDLRTTLQDWGYTPHLYHFDEGWHVDWIHCEDGDSIEEFDADTPEEAIDKAYNWFHSHFCNS